MKKVLTVGVFDYLHIGHIKLFDRCKSYGDYLIVAVQDSEYVKKFKPNTQLLYSNEERIYMVSSVKYVDKVIVYKSVEDIVKEIDYDVFITGPDQTHQDFQNAIQYTKENGKTAIVLPRTEGISSTKIKGLL